MTTLLENRLLWFFPVLFWAMLAGLSFAWNSSSLEDHHRELITNQGRQIATMVESVRLWNASHGGVYAPVSEDTPPNPYLIVPERDISSPSGRPLTMVNPAYMTRQLSGVLHELTDVEAHLTSLRPLNPVNTPRDWERQALELFEADQQLEEWSEFAVVDDSEQFRYISPLHIQQPCLVCHAIHGYKLGDLRGGISINFPTTEILTPMQGQYTNLFAIHLAVWLLLSLLSLLMLTRLRYHMLTLRKAKDEQEGLVQQRTTELQSKAAQYRKTEEKLRLILSSAAEGTFAVDVQGKITLFNPAGLRFLGYQQESEVLGKDVRGLLCPSEEDELCKSCGQVCAIQTSYLYGKSQHVEEANFRRADGSPLPVEYRSQPVFVEDEIAGAVITFADISERQARHQKIWQQANFDLLTGLYNRHAFMETLRKQVSAAKRRHEQFALLFIDLDGFKPVNDELGHEAGDQLLKEVAERLQAITRGADTVARLGGDEFTVILPDCTNEQTVGDVANKLLRSLGSPYHIMGEEALISASIGVAMFPEHGRLCKKLLKHADMAMYAAKRQGKNRYVIYQQQG